MFADTLAATGIPGGAYAIIEDGVLVASGGLGVRGVADPRPVGADTVFRIASVSKTMAAQLTALLVHEGRLRWDEPVHATVPGLAFQAAGHAQGLQLQHLLGQSTGIVSNAYDNLLEDGQSLDRILPQFRRVAPICAPGRCYTYQNILFSLVAPAIESRTGLGYEALVRERLFLPLGMRDASLGRAAFLDASNRAHPHVRRSGLWLPAEVDEAYYRVAPAAGVNASAHDLARWLQAQMGMHPEVLPAEVVAATAQPRLRTPRDLRRRGWGGLIDDAHYGLGWRIYRIGEEPIVMHSGWVRGFMAEISYSPRLRSGVVVLLNGESPVLGELGAAYWTRRLGVARSAAEG